MIRTLRAIRQTLWDIDALLVVLAFAAVLLTLPIPKTRLPIEGR
jgi:hypothetical protein